MHLARFLSYVKLCEENVLEADEARRIVDDFDEIMAEELRSPVLSRDKPAKLTGKIINFNFADMPRNRRDTNWTGQGGPTWFLHLADVQLKTRHYTIPFEGVTQLGIRHPIANKPGVQAPHPERPKISSSLESSASSSRRSSWNRRSGALGREDGTRATVTEQERHNNARKGAKEKRAVGEVVVQGKRKRGAALKAEAGRVDGFWGGVRGSKRVRDGVSGGAARGGGQRGGRGSGQTMQKLSRPLDGRSEVESDASGEGANDLLDDLDDTDDDEGEAEQSPHIRAEPHGQERAAGGRAGSFGKGEGFGLKYRDMQSQEGKEASGEDVDDLLDGLDGTDEEESDAEVYSKSRAEPQEHAMTGTRAGGGRGSGLVRGEGVGVKIRVAQAQQESKGGVMHTQDVDESDATESPKIRSARRTRELTAQERDVEEGDEKHENEDASGSAESDDDSMEAKAREFDDILSYFNSVGLPTASPPPEKPRPPSMARVDSVKTDSTKISSTPRGGHAKDCFADETRGGQERGGDHRSGAEDESFLRDTVSNTGERKPLSEHNESPDLDSRGEMDQSADIMMPENNNGATAANERNMVDGEDLRSPSARPRESNRGIEQMDGVDVDSRPAKADEGGVRADGAGSSSEMDSDLEQDMEAMIDEESGEENGVGSDEDADSSSEEEFAAFGMIEKVVGDDIVAIEGMCEEKGQGEEGVEETEGGGRGGGGSGGGRGGREEEDDDDEEEEEEFAAVGMMAKENINNSVVIGGERVREEDRTAREEEDATSSGEDDSDGEQAAKDFEDFLADL